MFYEIEVKGHVRVPPDMFASETSDAVLQSLNQQFDGFISKELGVIMGVTDINEINEGVIIPGDGAAYYDCKFKILSFIPELNEVSLGRVNDITDFGAFINIGPIDGMVHIAQTMDDYVSFSKSNVLAGKDTKKVLKVGDQCRTRIIAISYKDISNPKIGLTMRQHRLGAYSWIAEELKKEVKKKSGKE